MTQRDRAESLSASEQRFVQEYLIDLDGAAAARRAGYSERRAKQTAHELLRRPKVAAAIKAGQETQRVRCEIAAATVVDELAKLGFANIFDFIKIDANGRPYTDFSAVTRDQAAAIQELVVETTPAQVSDDGVQIRPEVTKVRFKLADKRGPLTDLGRHLGLFEAWKGKDGEGEGARPTESARELVARRIAGIAARTGPGGNSDGTD